MGHSDIASYLALGYNWLRVPEVLRFNLHGTFKPGVCAKDIALRIAQLYGEDAAPYLAVEFSGPLTTGLPMSERLVLCNMVIDFGAKTGYIQAYETTARFMAQRAPDYDGPPKPRTATPTVAGSSPSMSAKSNRSLPSRMICRTFDGPTNFRTYASTKPSSAPAQAGGSRIFVLRPPS